jgi:L-cysteine:1D-myo-inositol 2-amino-2-deoxy-alpha-D-glucopyranoside ligase
LIEHHYRFEWEWDEDMFARNAERLANWGTGTTNDDDQLLNSVRDALDDDLDTPRAIALIDKAVANGVDVTVAARLLGIELKH